MRARCLRADPPGCGARPRDRHASRSRPPRTRRPSVQAEVRAEAVIVEAASVARPRRRGAGRGRNVELALPLVERRLGRDRSRRALPLSPPNPTLQVMPDATLRPDRRVVQRGTGRPRERRAECRHADRRARPGRGLVADRGPRRRRRARRHRRQPTRPTCTGSASYAGPTSRARATESTTTDTARSWPVSSPATELRAPAHATRHLGVAPAATLVSVKVAGADGSTTVARVIAGIGWVVSHRDTYDIGVLNLSFGVDAPMPYEFNPLSAAVEAAWASGITVVVSAGNDGAGHVTSPGATPTSSPSARPTPRVPRRTHDDVVPSWSGREQFRRLRQARRRRARRLRRVAARHRDRRSTSRTPRAASTASTSAAPARR